MRSKLKLIEELANLHFKKVWEGQKYLRSCTGYYIEVLDNHASSRSLQYLRYALDREIFGRIQADPNGANQNHVDRGLICPLELLIAQLVKLPG